MNFEILSLESLLLFIACYIYGSIPYAYIFTYWLAKKRITSLGSGNIGVANAFGVGGYKTGFLTVIGEASKAAIPLLLSINLYDSDQNAALIFLSAGILGTSYSLFLKGNGGQGGTVLLWGLLFLSPLIFLSFMAGFVCVYLISRKRYLTSVIAHLLLPVEIYLIDGNLGFIFFGIAAAIFYTLRYKPQRGDYAHYRNKMGFFKFFERTLGEK